MKTIIETPESAQTRTPYLFFLMSGESKNQNSPKVRKINTY